MKNITLHIPRRFRSDKVICTTHPENWEDLSPSQFIALVRAVNEQISEADLLVEMLDISHNVIKRLDAIQRYHLGCILEFLKSRAPFNHFILQDVDGLKPPSDGLSDITFGEFIHIDTFFCNYQDSNSKEDLLHLISCLYVRHDKKGNRPEFNGKIDTYRTKQIHDLKKQAIAMNYGLIRTWLEKAYPEVFPAGATEADNSQPKKKNTNGWVDVFDSIVGDDIINSEKYFNKSCTEVLRHLNKKIIESRKTKKK